MEIKNKYEITKEIISEFMKRAMRILVIYSFVIGAIALVLSVVLYRDGSRLLLGMVTASGVICLITGFIIVPYTVKEHMKQIEALHGKKKSQSSVTFTEEGIFLSEGDSSIKREYSNIIRVYETKNLWMLMFGKYIGIPVKKDAFTKGSEKEFRRLMKKVLPKNTKGMELL
ncbi:MAG: YcxB family protein [Tissierellia bacterium]|nr:YcxB family protein [Tissierellia bacterium]